MKVSEEQIGRLVNLKLYLVLQGLQLLQMVRWVQLLQVVREVRVDRQLQGHLSHQVVQ